MKTIKIFLASSEELKDERLEMTDLVSRLNQTFKGRGIQLELKRWEYLDSSMGDQRKQDEYNNVLRECDICLVLFWRRFGSYTGEELDVAYQCNKNKQKPEKIYVFFKNPDDDDVTTELKEFIKSYESRYGGHFFNKFLTVDTLKLEFLLQFELYQKDQLGEKAIEVRNEHVYVDNEMVADLNNIPFAANNEGFKKKQTELKDLEKEVEKKQIELKEKNAALRLAKEQQAKLGIDSLQMLVDMAQKAVNETEDCLQGLLDKKNKLKEEFEQEQQHLFNTARRITEQRGQYISQRMARAIEAFESGDAQRADIILDEAEKDADQALADIRIAKQVGEKSLEELILKASVKMSNDTISIDKRITETQIIYEKAIKLAKEVWCDNTKYADLIDKFGDFLQEFGKYDEAIIYRKELLSIRTKLFGKNSIDVAWALNKLGRNYDLLDNQEEAVKLLTEAETIIKKMSTTDLACESEIYNNLGLILQDHKQYEKAIDYHKKSLSIREEFFGLESAEAARSLNNIGNVLSSFGKHEEALEYHKKALIIKESTLGKYHCSTAISYYNIGNEYADLKNYSESIKYRKVALDIYEKVIGQKHPNTIYCYYWIGDAYYQMDDYVSSIEWTLKAANQGYKDAQRDIGWFYENGKGVEQNYTKAAEWFRKAAEQGHARAQYELATLYAEGKGISQDYSEAIIWLQKSAEQECADAELYLGWMYEFGHGVKQDYTTATEWYQKAANQGDATAQCNLGCMYETGRGIKQNYAKAFESYLKSAEQGHARAQYELATLYAEGKGVSQDYSEAIIWLQKSAEQECAEAEYYLGWMYANGKGVDKDYSIAFSWYTKAAEHGNYYAQNNLGVMYENGYGVNQDYAIAAEWYLKSAEQGNTTAQRNMGCMYLHGKGVDQNLGLAIEWYQKAITQGDKEAYNGLAWDLHLIGKYDEALPWAEKAVEAFPETPYIIDTLASVYQDLGRYDEALEQFELCLKLYKEQEDSEGIQETEEKIAELKELMKNGGVSEQ